MPFSPTPPQNLPADFRGQEPGSWAAHTMQDRLPRIIETVLRDGEFDETARARLLALQNSLPQGQIRGFNDPAAPDNAAWAGYVQPWLDSSWLTANWFFAECYFYRRLLAATGYYAPGPGEHIDPFAPQKEGGLRQAPAWLARLAAALNRVVPGRFDQQQFDFWLQTALWGNQADLSIWQAGDQNQPLHAASSSASHLLADDRSPLANLFKRLPLKRIDIILDNAGIELSGDLLLADYLLTTGAADEIVLHAKAHPTFVSDALTSDILKTIRFLTRQQSAAVSAAGERLGNWVSAGQMLLRSHFYWNAPLWFWQLDRALAAELSQSQLIISKGDANYRRIAGDFHWPAGKPFGDIAAYSPAPLLALRTLKSELVLGVDPATLARLDQQDPTWRTNGHYGLIQLAA
ncbi:MAG: protein-glutamate O-methyltransferase family protein [Anaerolineales bacterium]|nr:protein-glutamate O-methyltransferase family protein [Anaerolineales bacterium]